MTDKQRLLAGIGVAITLILAVLDQNIVTTASWPIVRDLDPAHGLERLPWLVTAYALAATAVLPLYGKLCDIHGAKRVYLAAVGVFALGSALCGLAQDMTQLIAFRALQGLGGGGLMSVTMVVAAHLSPPGKRGSAGAAGGLIAGVGMVAGPLVGGLFTETLSWRWIFLINLPLSLAVLATCLVLRLNDGRREHRVDYAGAALLAAAGCLLVLVAEWGGRTHPWTSPLILGMIAAGLALSAAFARRQLTAAEPILPPDLLRNPVLRIALPVQLLLGFGLAGGIFYMVVYLQVAQHVTPTASSLYLLPAAIGMVASGALLSQRRSSLVTGLATITLALTLFGFLRADTPAWLVLAGLGLLGLGFGQALGPVMFLVMDGVPVHQLGTATTAVRFVQILGTAVGSAIFGVLLNRVAAAHGFVAGVDAVFFAAGATMLAAMLLATRLYKVDQLRTVSAPGTTSHDSGSGPSRSPSA
ncbi:MFS transporter [Thermoactinospora rubra]|uniref:MFS transporter n=1 Tax=Thermoactinospora rubra TaxID=1088767 RepID=UPI000A10D3AD|nr:MFS transporter [Thermoactinospora rubra]